MDPGNAESDGNDADLDTEAGPEGSAEDPLPYKTLGKLLYALRRKRQEGSTRKNDWSQRDLARRVTKKYGGVGLMTTAVSHFERGRRLPRAVQLNALLVTLGASDDETIDVVTAFARWDEVVASKIKYAEAETKAGGGSFKSILLSEWRVWATTQLPGPRKPRDQARVSIKVTEPKQAD